MMTRIAPSSPVVPRITLAAGDGMATGRIKAGGLHEVERKFDEFVSARNGHVGIGAKVIGDGFDWQARIVCVHNSKSRLLKLTSQHLPGEYLK